MKKKNAQADRVEVYPLRLKSSIIKLARQDANRFVKQISGIFSAIVEAHFALKTEERAKVYTHLPVKHMGRKVSV